MKQNRLGKSSLIASAIGLGCANLHDAGYDLLQTRQMIDEALAVGINFFDITAPSKPREYAEELFGQALGTLRDNVVLSTSFGGGHGVTEAPRGRQRYWYIRSSVDASLRRLRTDHIDICHQYRADSALPIEELLYTLETLAREGKIRYFGVAGWETWRFIEACSFAEMHQLSQIATRQITYPSLSPPIEGIFQTASQWGTSIVATEPLADISHNMSSTSPIPSVDGYIGNSNTSIRLQTMREFQTQLGVELGAVALATVVSHPDVGCTIASADDLGTIKSASSILERLTESDISHLRI